MSGDFGWGPALPTKAAAAKAKARIRVFGNGLYQITAAGGSLLEPMGWDAAHNAAIELTEMYRRYWAVNGRE